MFCFVLWTHIYPTQNHVCFFLMTVFQLLHSSVFLFTPNNLVPGCHNIFCECFLQLHFYKEGNTGAVLNGELDYKRVWLHYKAQNSPEIP